MVNVGNALSPYWHAFTVAALSTPPGCGLRPPADVPWHQFLPACAPTGFSNAIRRTKALTCTGMYTHGCASGWPAVAGAIGSATKSAVARQIHADNLTLPEFARNDWLFYDRCELFTHDDHGPLALRALRHLPFRKHDRVLVLAANTRRVCTFYQDVRRRYLLSMFPTLRFKTLDRGNLQWDFARLVFAPTVVVPWTGSSWALWATIGNTGRVYTAPINTNVAQVRQMGRPNTVYLDSSLVLKPKKHIGTVEIALQDIGGNLSLFTATHARKFRLWLTQP